MFNLFALARPFNNSMLSCILLTKDLTICALAVHLVHYIKVLPPTSLVPPDEFLLHNHHLPLQEESRMHSLYKEEAVKCIVKALECCLFDKMFIPNCRRALLMLGGHFSFSGEIITETWLLKKAGFNCYTYNDEDDQTISEEESRMREDWLKSVALILLQYGKKSFQVTLSKCWMLGNPDLVSACVVTTAWLSHALTYLSVPALQRSAFSAFMPRLKECLKFDLDIKLKVLASLILLNFSKILECRIRLISYADEIHDPLKSLKEVTWTAKHLLHDIFDETS